MLGLNGPETYPTQVGDYRPPGPVEQLRQQKSLLEAQLEKVNSALEALNKNPEVATILELVGKALR